MDDLSGAVGKGVQPPDGTTECRACEGSGRGEPIGDYGAYYRDGEVYEFPGWKDCDECGGTGELPTLEHAYAEGRADQFENDRRLLGWAYGKLCRMSFAKMDDALAMDEIKLMLMQAPEPPIGAAAPLSHVSEPDGTKARTNIEGGAKP